MSKRFLIGGAIVAAVIAMTATPTSAQLRNCAPREIVVTRLAEIYGETRQSMGLGANNAVMEVFASDETGSWTITMTLTNGMTCLVESGQAFEPIQEELPNTDDDA